MTKISKNELSARKKRVEDVLRRNHHLRSLQLEELESLRGGRLDVLQDNPTFGLEKFDKNLAKIVGKVGKMKENEVGRYKYEEFVEDYKGVEEDEEVRRDRVKNKEKFKKILLPGIGAVKHLKKNSKSRSSGVRERESSEGVEEMEVDLELDEDLRSPERPRKEGFSYPSKKFEGLEDKEFEESWDEFLSDNSPLETEGGDFEEAKLSSEEEAHETASESEVEDLRLGEEIPEKECDLFVNDDGNLEQVFIEAGHVEKVDIRDFKGQEYLDMLLGDNEHQYHFVNTRVASPKEKSEDDGYFFGKTYDFGENVRPVVPTFKYENDDAESAGQIESEVESIISIVPQPELREKDSILLCDTEEEIQGNNALNNFATAEEVDCENEFDNIVKDVEVVELEADLVPEDEARNILDEDAPEVVELEKRLRKSLKVDENETGHDEKPIEFVEVAKDLLPSVSSKDSANTKSSKRGSKLGRKMSKLFRRRKSSKGKKEMVSAPSEEFEFVRVRPEKEMDELSEDESVKPWEMKLDEMKFYASRNLRDNLIKKGVTFNDL